RIADRHRLVAEGDVAADVGGLPGPGHTEDSRTLMFREVGFRPYDLDFYLVHIAKVHSGGPVEVPVGATFHFLVRPADQVRRRRIADRHRLVAEGDVAADVGGLPGPGHTEDPRTLMFREVGFRPHDLDFHLVHIAK